jgi:hypothetical protein
MKIILVIIAFVLASNTFAQEINLDSLILSKEPKFIDGTVPISVIPGYEAKAISWQATITEAKKYFEKKYEGISIKARLAVLDSVHWTNEICSYGYTFGYKNWIVLPGGEDFNDYIRIFGAAPFRDKLIIACQAKGMDPNEIPESGFQFVTVHELGHLIVQQYIKGGIPGDYLNEVLANVIAWDYFTKNKPDVMKGFELFFNVFRNNYTNPKYTTLTELSKNMGRMDMGNYVWYHSNMMKLVEDIYAVKDVDLLSCIKKLSQEQDISNLDNYKMASLLDKYYHGIFTKWLERYN